MGEKILHLSSRLNKIKNIIFTRKNIPFLFHNGDLAPFWIVVCRQEAEDKVMVEEEEEEEEK